MGSKFNDSFLWLFCEEISNGTKQLVLRGREVERRGGKRLHDDDMYNVTKFLKNNPQVVYVNLSYNRIGDEGMQIFAAKLFNNVNNLQHLDLIGCDVTWQGVADLCDNFKYINLTSLRLASNPLGALGNISCSNLLKLRNLKYLDLANSGQTLQSVAYLNAAILGKLDGESWLQVLDYSGIVPCTSIYQGDSSSQLADQLAQTLAMNASLVELHLQKNELEGHCIERMLFGLKKHRNLLLLDVGYNKIGDYGVEQLFEWLNAKPKLIALNLAGNSIGDAGAKVLSKSMLRLNLKYLDISYNHIKNDGMVALLSCVQKKNAMNMFFFWGNQFSHRANKVLEATLKQGVLHQNGIDVKLYMVDKMLCHAYYPNTNFSHRSFNVLDYDYPPFLRSEKSDSRGNAAPLLRVRCNSQCPIKNCLKSRSEICNK